MIKFLDCKVDEVTNIIYLFEAHRADPHVQGCAENRQVYLSRVVSVLGGAHSLVETRHLSAREQLAGRHYLSRCKPAQRNPQTKTRRKCR